MSVPPIPAPGGSAADIPGFGTTAPDPAAPAPYAATDPNHPAGHETAYAAPADAYTGYDTYDPAAASSDIAATSGFGFPVPMPGPVPVSAHEFGSGYHEPTNTSAGFVPEPSGTGDAAAVPGPAASAEPPSAAPGFAAEDSAGLGAVDPLAMELPYGTANLPGGPVVSYTVMVNGATQVVDRAWLGENLLHVLRERLGLPGAKDGCGQGVCGACTVLVDGAPAAACLVPAATVGERGVVTVEGLSAQGGLSVAIQQALIDHGAVQCGFCVPGIVVSAHALLARLPGADEATIRRALAGHPCRCVGPNRMVAAVCAVAAGQATEPGASLFESADAPEPHA